MNSNQTLILTRNRRTQLQDLPPELIQSILSRISINDIFKIRYTCKTFQSLTDDPRFPFLHYHHSLQNPNPSTLIISSSLCDNKLSTYYIPDAEHCEQAIKLPLLEFADELNRTVSCLNGFICFADCLVVNPVVGDEIGHPPSTTKFPVNWGFGYRRTARKPRSKVVRVFYNYGATEEYTFDVITLGSTNWRCAGSIRKRMYLVYMGVFVEGFLHWFHIDSDSMVVDIVTFSIEDETFGSIPIPESIRSKKNMTVGGVLIGVLGRELMICDYTERAKDLAQVWVMKPYGVKGTWVLQYVIPICGKCRFFCPVRVQKDGRVLLKNIGSDFCGLFLYDPKTGTHEELNVSGLPKYFEAECHVGTLMTIEDVIAMKDWDQGRSV